MEELAQDKRLQMKEFFNLWSDRTSFSKTILFLSFHTIQNKQRGAARQTLLCFLSFKGACQPKRVSLTEKGVTQLTPNKENKRSHKTFALGQWIRMWFIISSSSQHKGHLLANFQPLLFSWSWVSTFPQEASQAKKPTLAGWDYLLSAL